MVMMPDSPSHSPSMPEDAIHYDGPIDVIGNATQIAAAVKGTCFAPQSCLSLKSWVRVQPDVNFGHVRSGRQFPTHSHFLAAGFSMAFSTLSRSRRASRSGLY